MARQIGTLAEKSLHAALKAYYSREGDRLECDLEGYVIDILRSDQCIEIQTRHLFAMKKKLTALLDRYPIHVVHPIAQERRITRVDSDGAIVSRRKSPRKGTVYHLFPELVSLPKLINHPNLTLEALLIREEQIWLDDGQGSWRRKHWSIADRRLLEVVQGRMFHGSDDFAVLIPADLPSEFDSGELAKAIHEQRHVAQKMVYCLREMGVLRISGKRGNALLYHINRPIA